VAVIASPGGAQALATRQAARDFLTDADAHGKFIGYTVPRRGHAAVVGSAAGPGL